MMPALKLPRFYFYPRPPRGGRPPAPRDDPAVLLISTHALREEGDYSSTTVVGGFEAISTHALREEGDVGTILPSAARALFLPTPSARRATLQSDLFKAHPAISTHALREEGDGVGTAACGGLTLFLPTPSARRATYAGRLSGAGAAISTHALREEGDLVRCKVLQNDG